MKSPLSERADTALPSSSSFAGRNHFEDDGDGQPVVPPSKRPGHFDSALDDAESVSSAELPALSVPSERVRKRSVLDRHVPSGTVVFSLQTPDDIELSTLSPVSEYPRAISSSDATPPLTGLATNASLSHWGTRGDLEVASSHNHPSVPPTPLPEGSAVPLVSASQRAMYRRKSRLHFAALCFCLFLEGWNDGSTGPMLPTVQKYHHIGFAVISLLFVVNCIGFVSGAMANVFLNDRFGMGKVLVVGAVSQLCAYVMLSTGGPFVVMCFAFGFAGFGMALQNAQANGFVGSLKEHVTTKMSLIHASYGMGAFAAPLVATHFATQRHWYFHYLISAGIGTINVAFLYSVFKFRRQDDVLAEEGQAPGEADTANQSKYRQILGLSTVHFLSIWSLIYVGVEVTLGGWIVTFIQQKRGGGASAGFISSGFFGGLMLGRVVLMWLNRKIGERRVMYLYTFLAIQLQVTIWVVPSLVENAVAISLIGLLLGPMYPILMTYCTRVLPKWLLTGSVGWIAGMGNAGSAMLPFVTGLLASNFGIGSLQPFIVSMMSTMIVIWAFIPRPRRVD